MPVMVLQLAISVQYACWRGANASCNICNSS